MKKYIFMSLISLFLLKISYAQTASDTINQTDKNGKKQGYWKKIVNDTLKYEGYFCHASGYSIVYFRACGFILLDIFEIVF